MESARERERLLALNQQTELARAKLQSELTVASRIQADLFPSELPQAAGYDLAARNRAARYCGGDYYDALVTADGGAELLLCVADVAGKGLPAALVMSNMQATLRALAGGGLPLPELAQRASDLLFAATAPEKYVTAALLRIATADGSLRFVGAGHLDNVIVRADGSIVPLASTGLPLGLMEGGGPYTETTQTLAAGDLVVLYSDGVTDAQNGDSEEFGECRLYELLARHAGASPDVVADAVLAAVDLFVAGAPQFDDITILVLRRR
jgi:sigma-B regulation protein RsbU (phosphoserine phosphatase)